MDRQLQDIYMCSYGLFLGLSQAAACVAAHIFKMLHMKSVASKIAKLAHLSICSYTTYIYMKGFPYVYTYKFMYIRLFFLLLTLNGEAGALLFFC